jgi:hypothetical protein
MDPAVVEFLNLLKILFQINSKQKLVDNDLFQNLQITSKITHQLTSPDAIDKACQGDLPK